MSYTNLLHPKAKEYRNKSEEALKKRIKNSLRTLSTNPKKGTKLKHSDFWRIQIGEHRAIYEIVFSKKKVKILFIGHRREVYDDFSRLL